MASQRPYNGVAHDIAHHAASELSFVYPCLWQACQQAGIRTVLLDLIHETTHPPLLSEPVISIIHSLKDKFFEMVNNKKLEAQLLENVTLEFHFPFGTDGSVYRVQSTIKLKNGKRYSNTQGCTADLVIIGKG